MTDRPIIFSASMVQALLDGRKTMTRRILKLPTKGEYVRPDMGGWEQTTIGGGSSFRIAKDGARILVPEMAAIWNRTTGTCIVLPYRRGRWFESSTAHHGKRLKTANLQKLQTA